MNCSCMIAVSRKVATVTKGIIGGDSSVLALSKFMVPKCNGRRMYIGINDFSIRRVQTL